MEATKLEICRNRLACEIAVIFLMIEGDLAYYAARTTQLV